MALFDIEGSLGRIRLTEDDNESLLTIKMQKIYMNTKITEGSTLVTDKTEVSIFITETPHENKKIEGHTDQTSKHDTTKRIRVLEENRNSSPRRVR